MTQRLLTLVLLPAVGSLTAQDVIWTEDFGDGPNGWTINTLLCGGNAGAQYGNNSGPEYGIWQLTGGTVFGEPIEVDDNSVFEWSFLNDTEYSLTFYDPTGVEDI